MSTTLLAMEKLLSNILGITLTLALGIVLATSVTVSSIMAAANTTKAAASNTNSTGSSNPINKIGQAIVNGLKGLGNLITGNKK